MTQAEMHSFARHNGTDHDNGLEHNHNWAAEPAGIRRHGPLADVSAARIPSSVHHDDSIYGAG